LERVGAIAAMAALLVSVEAQAGRIKFLDGSSCYYVSPYFKVNERPSVSLYIGNSRVQGPFTIGRFGEYGSAPGRPGIQTPGLITSYTIKVICDGVTYSVPIENQFLLPSMDIEVDNRSPRVTSIGILAKLSVIAPSYTRVRRVPPGALVRLQFVMKDPGANGAEPDHRVKSIFGTLTFVSRESLGNNEWRIKYDWQLPNARGLFDVYVSIDDGRGGFTEAATRINAEEGPQLLANSEPKPPSKPSDKAKQLDHFLTMFSTKASTYESQGADSARSACAYYFDLGFAASCDGDNMDGAITFTQWKDRWGFKPPKNGGKQLHAIYINKVDLGLARNMNAIRNSDGVAFYVCNHPAEDPQLDDDPDFARPLSGEALVACVAMEYSVTPGVNDGKKFTKFLVFDPQGRITRRVNLDGRGMKHIPGACVVCHGATSTFSRYPETPGTGNPVLGANFLPFDLDNFEFSDNPPYRRTDQEAALRQLNEYVRDRTKPAQPIKELINGWYAGASFDGDFVPPGWSNEGLTYSRVIKQYCRTCHVAMRNSFNTSANFNSALAVVSSYVCGNSGLSEKTRYSMPNALVTFDKFWNDPTATDSMRVYLSAYLGQPLTCDPPQ
jgi:hypothetical protein